MKQYSASYGASLAFILSLAFAFAVTPYAPAGQTIIINGDVADSVYGNGHGPTGAGTLTDSKDDLNDPSNNTIIVNSGTIDKPAGPGIPAGGWVSGGSRRPPLPGNGVIAITGNNVIFNGGAVPDQEIYGAYGVARSADPANSVAIMNNSVIIRGSSEVGDVFGGYGSVGDHSLKQGDGVIRVTGNSVTIGGDARITESPTPWMWTDGVFGGGGYAANKGFSLIAGNSVTVEGRADIDNSVYGGASQVDGAASFSVTGNSVTITGGTIRTEGSQPVGVYGGIGVATNHFGDFIAGSVTNNTVAITGNTAKVEGHIYGGYVYFWADDFCGTASVTQNVMVVSGNPDISESRLYGGLIEYGFFNIDPPIPVPGMDAFTGNTLHSHTINRAIAGMQNFNYMNFFLPETTASGDRVFIASDTVMLSEFAGSGNAGTGRMTTVNVGVQGSRSPLVAGEYVILIDTDSSAGGDNLVGNPASSKSFSGMHGVTLQYEFDIWKGDTLQGQTPDTGGNRLMGHQLVASLPKNPKAAPGTEALSKGSLIDLSMLLNQGADLAAGSGIAQALCAAQCPQGFGAFAALSGGWSRYDTGSHADMSSMSLLTGVAKGMTTENGCLTLGAFFEHGAGSYETDGSYPFAVRGGGRNHYLGGGVLGRMNFSGAGPGYVYAEGSVRAGTIHNSYDTGLSDMIGNRASYSSSTAYCGAHLGIGRVRRVTDSVCIDLHAQYFWARRHADSAALTTGERIEFRHVDSHRVRVGARLARDANKQVSPYVGIAYEHEFASKARTRYAGYDLAPSSLRGGTGMGEAGIAVKPSRNRSLAIDVRAHGYLGKRSGVGGSVRIGMEF